MIPFCARVLGGVLVERQRDVAHPLGQRPIADQLHGALEVDRLVVPDVGLGRRGEQRLGQAVGLPQAGGQLDPATPRRSPGSPSSPSR